MKTDLSNLISRINNLPESPWTVDSGTMADKMVGCWLIRSSSKHDFPSWLLATSGHKNAKEIAQAVCDMRNLISEINDSVQNLDSKSPSAAQVILAEGYKRKSEQLDAIIALARDIEPWASHTACNAMSVNKMAHKVYDACREIRRFIY